MALEAWRLNQTERSGLVTTQLADDSTQETTWSDTRDKRLFSSDPDQRGPWTLHGSRLSKGAVDPLVRWR